MVSIYLVLKQRAKISDGPRVISTVESNRYGFHHFKKDTIKIIDEFLSPDSVFYSILPYHTLVIVEMSLSLRADSAASHLILQIDDLPQTLKFFQDIPGFLLISSSSSHIELKDVSYSLKFVLSHTNK